MFSDEMIAKIYSHKKAKDIPIVYLIETVNVVQEVLEEMGYDYKFRSMYSTGSGYEET